MWTDVRLPFGRERREAEVRQVVVLRPGTTCRLTFDMKVRFTKLSDERHAVRVERRDGSNEAVELDSRSFLRHDLAHLAVELELGLDDGWWGSVARGGSLDGSGLDGAQLPLAETLAGPVQTIMRVEAGADAIRDVLDRVVPDAASDELAGRLHDRIRRLRGHWRATPYGDDMVIDWPEAEEAGTGAGVGR